MKELIKRLLRSKGVYVGTRRTLPFGSNLFLDLARLGFHPHSPLIDAGAHVGETSLQFAEAFPDVRIYSFEPVSGTFQKLLAATASRPSITCVNAALGTEEGTASIAIAEISQKNSLKLVVPGHGEPVPHELVRVTSLDRFLSAEGHDRVSLLKIDCEGYEPEVLRGASGLLSRGAVDWIFVEATFEADHPVLNSAAALKALLSPYGYYLSGVYDQAFSGQILFCNLLFRRIVSDRLVQISW